jgi:hypothetical protein
MDPTLARTIGGSTDACKSSNFTEHCGNRTDKYLDDGVDLGGPIFRDKLWAWGRIGRTDVRILTLTGVPDETILNNYAFKSDYQATQSTRLNFTFFEGNKTKNGRGASAFHPSETTWLQTGPTRMYKGEGNFVVGQNLFAAARFAYITGGFSLVPLGGLNNSVYVDDSLVWHGSYQQFSTNRPQAYGGVDASYFVGKNEVKFGFAYRRTPVDSLSEWPGNRTVSYANGYPDMLAYVYRDFSSSTVGKYVNGFVTDTLSLDRLTVQAGVRFDHQTSSLKSTSVPAVPGYESILPAISGAAADNVYDFNQVAPRVGVTYALDDSRKTIARASYALFASQLPGTAANFVSTVQYSYAYYNAVDKNGDHIAQPSELTGLVGTFGFDPANPGATSTANRIGDISSPRTNEFMVGVDRELMSNFGVSATFTYRRMTNLLWNPPVGATPSAYSQTATFAGTFANVGTVSIPVFGIDPNVDPSAGFEALNRPDYHQRYMGFELSATKRLSNKWMARLGFASSSWNEYFDGPNAILDKTPTTATSGEFAKFTAAGPLINGGPVVVSSAGSGKSQIYSVAPKYQLSANGLYQFPWGIDAGANLLLRQGYAEPFNRTRVASGDPLVPSKTVLIAPSADGSRLPNVVSLDARLEKTLKFSRTTLAIDLDVFNILNKDTVLGLQYDARSAAYNQVAEIMQPRIARLGVRFLF